jgi:hypothetical protein
MNGQLRQARRYHWLSEGLKSFVDEPHAAIEGPGQGEIVNLTDHRAETSRGRQLELLGALGPDGIARELATEPLIVSPTRLDFRSRTEGRTGIPSPCRCGSTTKRYGC